jgi:plastocyanin
MKRFAAACLLLGFTLVGCAQTSPQTKGESTQNAATQEDEQKVVILYGGRFNPDEISVDKGTSIVFKNKDREKHNVKIAALDVDQDIAAGDEWTHTFETVGEFAVENAIAQQAMKMTIVVDEGG